MALAALSPGMVMLIILAALFCGLAVYANYRIKPQIRAQQAEQQAQENRR